ncbi:uncharacterized protein LOC100832307 [Brachypodium distachyon]|uniref:uncharacterized protein LOC100832307 n=1 Tax=Brachypodium distachyon TaxID=15368 RepID=UPI00052FE78F|nr:uncharacterized protein LOC100832307 [Brachypodium distachyon]|eukprot:XP_010227264.1 uncharacterized protein LOC100832307 [Brachypodium distachyon]
MAGAVRAGAGGEIADDCLREVLARLIPAGGIQGLLRCAATCKRWRCVATERAFLRRIGLWRDNARRPSVLLGAFFQTSYRPSTAAAAADYDFDEPPERSPRHHNPPRFRSLQPGGADLAFDSFVPNADGGFDLARPLASRRGLLLVRLLPVGDCCVRVLQKLHLAVCRPQIGKKNHQGSQHLLLPQPPFYLTDHLDRALAGCAILTDAAADDDNSVDRQAAFKVLVLYIDLDELVCACAYSSATGTWSAPVSCCRATKFIRCGPRAGVVAGGGTVHWVCRNERSFYTLDVDISAAATTNVSFTEIPIKVHAGGMSRQPPPLPCVVKGGRLSLVTMQPRGGALELWTKREHDNDDDDHRCEWGWVHSSELIDLGSDRIDIVFFAESRGALLVEQGGAFSAIDLESKEQRVMARARVGFQRRTALVAAARRTTVAGIVTTTRLCSTRRIGYLGSLWLMMSPHACSCFSIAWRVCCTRYKPGRRPEEEEALG